MGLLEQKQAGSSLSRRLTTFVTNGTTGLGSIDMGSVFSILNVETDHPCRLRLYDNQASRDDSTEAARDFTDTSVNYSIALIGDFSMSSATQHSVDPILTGFSEVNVPATTYYRVEPSSVVANIKISTFLLEDNTVIADPGSNYQVENRRTLIPISASLAPLGTASIIVSDTEIPTTYLLVSASLSGSNTQARLRLYTTSSAINDAAEKGRPFEQEITGSIASYLIADVILSQSSVVYFTPKIVGSNLENVSTSLTEMKGTGALNSGQNELYCTLINTNPVGGTVPISASIHVFALED